MILFSIVGAGLILGRRPEPPRDPSGVRSHANFTGAERYATEAEKPEDAVRGRGLAAKLVERLRAAGLNPSEVIDEDWGALVEVAQDEEGLDVCVGYTGDDGWLVFACRPGQAAGSVPDTPFTRKLLTELDRALRELPGIEKLSWFPIEAFIAGATEGGAPSPVDGPT